MKNLRNWSELGLEIEINNKKFKPIIELAIIENINDIKLLSSTDVDFEIKEKKLAGELIQISVEYKSPNDSFPMNVCFSFHIEHGFRSVVKTNNSGWKIEHVNHQLELYSKLIEWGFINYEPSI